MMRKRTKVRIRRALLLLVMAAGVICGWKAGALLVLNAVHGFDRLPQLVGVLVGAWLMAQAAEWLGG